MQSRWASEPVRLVFVPKSSFVPNKFNQPMLRVSQKLLLYRLMRLRTPPWLVLSDVGPIPSSEMSPSHESSAKGSDPRSSPWPLPSDSAQRTSALVAADPTPHLSYLRDVQAKQPPKPEIEKFGAGYQDYLQAPLQPLADNLESITYEVFEKDPIKYEQYERAIAQALHEWDAEEKQTSSGTGAVVIAVAGSGRGPLVTRTLRASADTGVAVQVYAVEKNPNAYVLLQRHNELVWNRQVTVVKTDMRAWKGPLLPDGTHGHVDIIVSELLGSFADNELSPECLDGVQHVLNPIHGISIPSSYTAHLTPISTPKIHADLLSKSAADKDVFDLPYVVMLHQHDFLSTLPALNDSKASISSTGSETIIAPTPKIKTCWQFSHPLPNSIIAQSQLRRGGSASGGFGGTHGGDGANEHNARSCILSFPIAHRGVCHGLAGYFETVLYASSDISDSTDLPVSVELSTNPVTMEKKSKDMISWFPIFFPLKAPVAFPDGAELRVSMWRATDDRKVWYEWCVEAFIVMGTGERVRVGGGEMQSSRKNGCLM